MAGEMQEGGCRGKGGRGEGAGDGTCERPRAGVRGAAAGHALPWSHCARLLWEGTRLRIVHQQCQECAALYSGLRSASERPGVAARASMRHWQRLRARDSALVGEPHTDVAGAFTDGGRRSGCRQSMHFACKPGPTSGANASGSYERAQHAARVTLHCFYGKPCTRAASEQYRRTHANGCGKGLGLRYTPPWSHCARTLQVGARLGIVHQYILP
jgi:hypothetical protein